MTELEPFVGPVPLDAKHAVFGRDAELHELYGLVISRRIVLLHAPSGAGKSSLLKAGTQLEKRPGERVPVGLIARLQAKRFTCLGPMRVGNPAAADVESIRTNPGVGGDDDCRPNRYTISAITSLESQRAAPLMTPETVVRLRLRDYLARVTASDPEEQDYVLFFDQFEEIVTSDPNDVEERTAFFKQLGAVLVDPRWRAVIAMRSDYVGAIDPYVAYVPDGLSCRFYLDLFTEENARTAIIAPAQRSGLEIAAGAATKLVDELRQITVQRPNSAEPERVAGRYIEPVHLQLIGQRLWQKRVAGATRIGVDDVSDLGDVDAALGDYYDQCIETVRDMGTSELVIREWIQTTLINAQGIRGQIVMEPGATAGLSNEIIGRLVSKFLLRQEERRNVIWLELSHDRLIAPIVKRNRQAEASFGDVKGAVGDFYDRCIAASETSGTSAIEIREWIENKLIDADGHRVSLQRGPAASAGLPNNVIDKLVGAKLLRQHQRGTVTWLDLGQESWIEAILERNRVARRRKRSASRSRLFSGIVVGGVALLVTAATWQARQERDSARERNEKLRHASFVNQASANLVAGRPLSALAWLEAALRDVDSPAVQTLLHEARRNLWTDVYKQRSAVVALRYMPNGTLLSVDDVGDRHVPGVPDRQAPTNRPMRAIAISATGVTATIDSAGTLTIGADAVPVPGVADLTSLVFSDDGKQLAVANASQFQILDDKGHPRTSIQTPQQPTISSMAFSPNGVLLALREKNQIELRHTNAPDAEATILAPGGGEISSISFSPDGCRIVLATTVGTLVIASVFGEVLLRQAVPDIARVSFGTNPASIATMTRTGTAQLWSLTRDSGQGLMLRAATRELTLDSGPSAGVSRAAVAALGESASRGSGDGAGSAPHDAGPTADAHTLIPDVLPGAQPSTRQGQLVWSADGMTLLVAGPGRTAALWNVADGNPLVAFEETADISSALLSPDATTVVLGTQAGTVRTWNARYGSKVEEIREPNPIVLAAWFAPAGGQATKFVTMTSKCQGSAWSVDGQPLGGFQKPGTPSAITFVDDTHVLAACDRLYLWDLDSGAIDPVAGVPAAVRVAFAHDARRFVTLAPDASTLWEYSDGSAKVIGPLPQATSVIFDGDGTRLACLESDAISAWDDQTKQLGQRLPLAPGPSQAAFLPGRDRAAPRIAVAAGDTVTLWDVLTTPTGAASLHGSRVTWMQETPNGDSVVIGTDDGTASVFAARDLQPTTNPLKLGSSLSTGDISNDSTRLVTGTQDGAMQLWDIATGQPVSLPQVFRGGIGVVSFAPDGARVLVAGTDGVARVYDTARDSGSDLGDIAARCSPFGVKGGTLLVQREAQGCSAKQSSTIYDRMLERKNLLYAAVRALPAQPDLARAYIFKLHSLTEKHFAMGPLKQVYEAATVSTLIEYVANPDMPFDMGDLDDLVSLTTSYHRPDLTLAIYQRQANSESFSTLSARDAELVRLKIAEGELLTHDYFAAQRDATKLESPIKGYLLIAQAIRWTSLLGEHQDVTSAACDLRDAYQAWATQKKVFATPLAWNWDGIRNMLDVAPHESAIMQKVERVFTALQAPPHPGDLDSICSKGTH